MFDIGNRSFSVVERVRRGTPGWPPYAKGGYRPGGGARVGKAAIRVHINVVRRLAGAVSDGQSVLERLLASAFLHELRVLFMGERHVNAGGFGASVHTRSAYRLRRVNERIKCGSSSTDTAACSQIDYGVGRYRMHPHTGRRRMVVF